MYFKFISWAGLSKFKTYFNKIKVYLLLQHRKILEKSRRIIDEFKNLEQALEHVHVLRKIKTTADILVLSLIVTLCNSLEAVSGLWCY